MQDGRKALTVLMATLLVISAISLPLMMARAGVTGNLALTVDKDRGSPDEVVTVSGTAPIGAMVYVDFVRYTGTKPSPGNYEVITSTSVPVGTGGAFKTLITVPHVPMSDETHKYAIYAYVPGFEANTYDYVLFTVVPRLVISPKTTVTPGEVINVTGAGFPESATVDLYAQSYYVGSVGTDKRGDFVQVVSWEVQDLPKGTYNVTAVYNGVPIAYAPFTIIPGLYYWNYDAGRWVSLYTISGTWTRDLELGLRPLKVWGRGFEAETNVTSIVLRNIYYEYSKVVQNYTTMPLTTATNGSFRADLKLNLTPGGTYDAIVTTLEAYTFKGSLTINPYIEAYDYSKYSVTFGIDGRYTIEATRIPSLKITYASAQVIVFGWAFAPGTVTVAGTTTTVPATFFLDYIENKLVIATVINGTKIDDYTFLPDSNGFSAAIVVMPPSVTRGGHEIGQLQSITVPRLQFSARTNIWVGPTAFLSPLNGTVGPYTTIPYEFRGVGVVKGSIVGPFACLISGNRTCYSSTPGGKITYNPELYEEVKKGLGTEITVWGSGFDPNMDVYVFVRSTSFDLRTLYTSYFSKYGSLLQGLVPDGLLVANTTTDRYGSFKVKFVMPTLPGADYSIVVLVKTIAGGYEQVVAGSFTVIPGLFLNPAIAVGPYVAQVISTGNPYGTAGAVKGVAFRTTNFDSIYGGKYKQDFTDGIMGVNGHVVNWRITANGTLMSILSPYVYPGLFIPTLETGVYEVALILPDGSLTSPVHIGVINDLVLITQIHGNVVEIVTRTGTILASLDSIAKSLSDVNAKLESIEGDVATIKTDVATIKADISALKPVITRIDGNVATISTTLGDIKADISALKPVVSEIKDGVATVSTTVGAIKGKVDTIDGNVATIRTDVGTIKAAVTEVKAAAEAAQSAAKSAESVASSLMIPVWIAAAFAIIATIIAIVSVVLIQRKIAK
jgi:predicted  nucleic acid-binding Zn-ribbon protein